MATNISIKGLNIEVKTGPLRLMHQVCRKYPTPEITMPCTQIKYERRGLRKINDYSRPEVCDVLGRRLSSEGGGHEAVCQQKRWVLKNGELGVPHRLEKGTSVENTGP